VKPKRKRSGLPPGVTRYPRGKRIYYRFRMKGRDLYYFKAAFGTPEFQAEYDACVRGEIAPKIEVGRERYKAGTFNALIRDYYLSMEFLGLAATTRPNVRGILDRWRAVYGEGLVRDLQRVHVSTIMGSMRETPSAANNLLDRLRVLMKFAIDYGYRKDNPTDRLKAFKITSTGFHSWTEEEIAQFEARHPVGTKARLALGLLLYSGQRRGDVRGLGWKDVVNGRLELSQSKTGAELSLPILPQLRELLAPLPKDAPTFLTTHYGRPFSPAGFGNWFRKQCDAAGLKNCSAHGLRKAASRRMAEAGKSNAQIKSVTGHRTDKEVTRYTASASQKLLADQAMELGDSANGEQKRLHAVATGRIKRAKLLK